jgi:hypothetical protein
MKHIESTMQHLRATLSKGVAHRTEKDRYDCLFQHAVYLGSKTDKRPMGPGDA